MKKVFFIVSYLDYQLINEQITAIYNYFLDQNINTQFIFPKRYLVNEKVLSERSKFNISKNDNWNNITFYSNGKSYLVNKNGSSIIREMISAYGNRYTFYLEEKEEFDRQMMDKSDSYIIIEENLDVVEENLIKREEAYASLIGLEKISIPENILYGKTKKL